MTMSADCYVIILVGGYSSCGRMSTTTAFCRVRPLSLLLPLIRSDPEGGVVKG